MTATQAATHAAIPPHLRSLAAAVEHWCDERPEQSAVRLGADQGLSYRQLRTRGRQVAHGLAAAGLGPTGRVAFIGKAATTWAEVFVAASYQRAAAAPLNWRLSPREMAEIIADVEPVAVIVEPEFLPLLGHPAADDAQPRIHFQDGTMVNFERWLEQQKSTPISLSQGLEDTALLIYTSGTSGRAKGVKISNRAIAANTLLPAPWRINPGETVMVPAPLFHASGSGWLTYCLQTGSPVWFLTEIEPEMVIDMFASGKIHHALTVPAIVQMLLAHPSAAERSYDTLTTLIYGGSPMAPVTAEQAAAVFGCGIVQSYGMTETWGPITFLNQADHRTGGARLASAGRPAEGIEVGVFDPTTLEPVAVGETGEVWVKTPLSFSGYRNQPDETAAAHHDGWFRTGDIGYFDDGGYLFLCDRLKDMIVSGGENVYPIEVENVLMTHPGVAEVAVIGVPDERWGETVKALVVPRPGMEVTPAALLEYARSSLARYKCPTSIEFLELLPRNPSGKILKRELRAPYWQDQGRAIG